MGEHGRTQYPYLKQPSPSEAKYSRPDLPTCCYAISPRVDLVVSLVRDRPFLTLRWANAEPETAAISMGLTEAQVLVRVLKGDDADVPIAAPAWWDWMCRGWLRQDAKRSIGGDIFVFRLPPELVAIAKLGFPVPTSLRFNREDVVSLLAAFTEAFAWTESALLSRSRLSG
jgi:hypothetical protein